jgi:hypothetical protein
LPTEALVGAAAIAHDAADVLPHRFIASRGTIANVVGMAITAREHGWLGAASAGPSCASTIRQEVSVAQPEFNQHRRVELATALALAQLCQNLVGEHA